jgi:hypothetical protein
MVEASRDALAVLETRKNTCSRSRRCTRDAEVFVAERCGGRVIGCHRRLSNGRLGQRSGSYLPRLWSVWLQECLIPSLYFWAYFSIISNPHCGTLSRSCKFHRVPGALHSHIPAAPRQLPDRGAATVSLYSPTLSVPEQFARHITSALKFPRTASSAPLLCNARPSPVVSIQLRDR